MYAGVWILGLIVVLFVVFIKVAHFMNDLSIALPNSGS